MKKLFKHVVAVSLLNVAVSTAFAYETQRLPCIAHGFYVGVGGSWNTIDETFHSILFTSTEKVLGIIMKRVVIV